MRIVFMGTPEFAVPSLRILHEHGYSIVGVITATDKMGGRGGKKKLESAVKKYARAHDLPVLQPPNLKNPEFVEELRSLKADLQVVVAFRMLPQVVWDMPPIGTINLHGSLLPQYRGAAPINWAVINGEQETGVTTFFLKHKIDTGDLLLQRKLKIGPNETAGEVHDRMMQLGAEVVLESVQAIERGDYVLHPQDESKVSKAPKIFRETCEIAFDRPVEEVHNFIRGLSPYPTAWATLEGAQLKIFRAEMEKADHKHKPGSLHSDGKSHLKFAAEGGYISVKELQLQGRRRMSVQDFLNGFELPVTDQ